VTAEIKIKKLYLEQSSSQSRNGCHGTSFRGGKVGAAKIKIKNLYLEQSSSQLKRMPRNLFRVVEWLGLMDVNKKGGEKEK